MNNNTDNKDLETSFMVTEVAVFTAIPGKEGRKTIAGLFEDPPEVFHYQPF